MRLDAHRSSNACSVCGTVASAHDGCYSAVMFDGFTAERIDAGETTIFVRRAGSGCRCCCCRGPDVQGEALAAGHFFPEDMPGETAARLERFLAPAS